MTDQIEFQNCLAETACEVDLYLAELLTEKAELWEVMRPQRLIAAMRHAVLAGGKRLRPFLAIETAKLLGGNETRSAAYAAAAAVELMHCYSLVHDDLPAMDDDDLRRGRPTVHKAYDEATAILAGDALQCLAFAHMADPRYCKDAAIRAELVSRLAQASGIGGMVGGQSLDLAHEGRYGEINPDIKEIRTMQSMKTGALLSFSVDAGAIIGQASDTVRSNLTAYGQALGLAFQIADDLLDLEATSLEMGKQTGKDAARGKITLVDHLGRDAAHQECNNLLKQAITALAIFGSEADILRDAARFVITRRV